MEDQLAAERRASRSWTAATGSPSAGSPPTRGELLGDGDEAIVELRPVVRIGIDKSAVSGDAAAGLGHAAGPAGRIDAKAYAKRSPTAGPEAFVEAIVFRADDARAAGQRPGLRDPGRAADRGRADAGADPRLRPADHRHGRRGDQGDRRRLRRCGRGRRPGRVCPVCSAATTSSCGARPGYRSSWSPAKPTGALGQPVARSPSPSPVPTPEPVTVFEAKPVAGEDLTITLISDLQKLAEKTLAKTKPASALVAIRPSTGAVVAAANNAGHQRPVASPPSARPRPARPSRWRARSPCCGPG